jgi:hypothetical protein
LPIPLREQDLAERIVDFVRAGMEQVLRASGKFSRRQVSW